jgi:predicted Rossmann fold nucleotide-binding protein DprA/Smf involved in DNA uptake
MKLAIVGSRDFDDYEKVIYYISEHFGLGADGLGGNYITEVVSGGASGADVLGKRLAKEYNIKYTEFPADWNKHGKAAGYIRNEDIVKNSDKVIAFWDGKSKGTMHTINLARKYKKDTIIIYV